MSFVELLPDEEDADRIRDRLRAGGHSEHNVKRGTKEAWQKIRERIYVRDEGHCNACGDPIPIDVYECGHIIDRMVGGTDRDSNLVTMCNVCNRLKPIHTTRSAYLDWVTIVRHHNAVVASQVLP